MRTTLTLDPDVSIELEALRRKHGLSLKDAVNNTLRCGLRAMTENDKPSAVFETATFNLGLPRVPLDNIAEALATADGDAFR